MVGDITIEIKCPGSASTFQSQPSDHQKVIQVLSPLPPWSGTASPREQRPHTQGKFSNNTAFDEALESLPGCCGDRGMTVGFLSKTHSVLKEEQIV